MSILLRRREGSIEILTLNRPEQRNALTPELMEELSSAFEQAQHADEVRVVVVTASGDRAFCAGMDLKAFAAGPGDRVPRSTAYFEAFIEGRFPKPIIAAINATAVAGGLELMMGCDLAVASRDAKFGLPEVKYGLFPAGSGVLLPARVPLAIALELALTGDSIDAERAYQLGLVNRVVEPNAVLDTALELARRIAENAPMGLAVSKRLMWACAQEGIDATRPQVKESIDQVFNSEDALEGAQAFAQRRVPQWKGR
ncbi:MULTISPECIES: enoyl-CoA hydratase-related protein [Pseudomonadaceae]|jgi:enoyl-CoA hydratase|uniref:Enoyl-CoA hydratase-related protein n=1 Tax=Ectopseudomonas toyotomiensis TaxID=554344 RepID=A0AA42IMD3_9GAMM|nr:MULTISPECIES: enoyl-CoA hydratase-related protein [Pseudomonadaceae]RRU92603.1 enoyl-CoA hydratase [Stutzerimonas xanthomarina]MBA1263133.1 enoyl-CoA hydratase [Stutzerimonas stutzeri]MBG0842206.1 enoyl-CoA hydratase/isomerase family protein [Pseudomonas toyotomiensis]MDH0702070.1 enoyl-CoA hydratase-related protein [Pseudomonas toyotomiensis]MDH1559478.1 enoyl-CoA hydratase-related protein [Pseudomonas chengduensis]